MLDIHRKFKFFWFFQKCTKSLLGLTKYKFLLINKWTVIDTEIFKGIDNIYFIIINPFKPEFTIVIFIHYKPWIAVAILDL